MVVPAPSLVSLSVAKLVRRRHVGGYDVPHQGGALQERGHTEDVEENQLDTAHIAIHLLRPAVSHPVHHRLHLLR